MFEKIKLGINGPGSIGKLIPRILAEREIRMEVSQYNSKSSNVDSHIARFNTDSDYQHQLISPIIAKKNEQFKDWFEVIDASTLKSYHDIYCTNFSSLDNFTWDEYIYAIIECSGQHKSRKDLSKHFGYRTQKNVILACPTNDDTIPHVVVGVNDHKIDIQNEGILSNSSCTTNCAAPIHKVIVDNKKIKLLNSFMTVIHSPTGGSPVDNYHRHETRGRNVLNNIIPTKTGVSKALIKVLPELKGKVFEQAFACWVPVKGSAVHMTMVFDKPISKEELISMFQSHELVKNNIIKLSHTPLVSSDILRNDASAIIDLNLLKVQGNMISLLAFYDNRWGYVNRLIDLLQLKFFGKIKRTS